MDLNIPGARNGQEIFEMLNKEGYGTSCHTLAWWKRKWDARRVLEMQHGIALMVVCPRNAGTEAKHTEFTSFCSSRARIIDFQPICETVPGDAGRSQGTLSLNDYSAKISRFDELNAKSIRVS